MANIDKIVNVMISLGTAGVYQRSFDGLMLLMEYEGVPRVTRIADPDELLDAPYSAAAESGAYLAALAAFSQTPSPVELYIGRIDADDASAAATMNAITDEDDSWYGFVDTTRSATKALAYAAWGEAHTKIFGNGVTGDDAVPTTTTDLASQFKIGNFFRTLSVHINDADHFPEVAWMANRFTTLPGSETWANVTLAGVESSILNNTQLNNIESRNGNYFTPFRNVSITRNGKVAAGEWLDIIRGRDWLQEDMRVNCFNALINRRIPFTDDGIAVMRQAMVSSLDLAQRRGFIAPDVPNDEGNGIIPGYTVSLPRARDISLADRRARKLTDVTFTATLANAIHAMDIRGSLVYDTLPARAA